MPNNELNIFHNNKILIKKMADLVYQVTKTTKPGKIG